MHFAKRITENSIHYLYQAVELLGRLTDEQYMRKDLLLNTSSVGAHMRHTLDHYFRFLDGLEEGRIDYEARTRGPRLDIDRAFAIKQIKETIKRVASLAASNGDRRLMTRIEAGDRGVEEIKWATSTVARELDFILSHTIHHYGMIAIILRIQQVEPGAEFGIAPSTLRYMRESVSCAR